MNFLSQILPLLIIGLAAGLILAPKADEWEETAILNIAHALAFLALILASIGLRT